MRKDHGSKSIASAQRFEIKGAGDGRFLRQIDLYIKGTADTGDTVALDELSSITLNHNGESPLDAIVSNVRPYEIIAFNRYMGQSIYFASAEAGTVEVNYSILFDVLPELKPGLVNIFLLEDDHSFVLEIDEKNADFASGNVYIDDRYHLQGQMVHFPRYRRIARDLTDETPFYFPKNTVYIVVAPGSSANPTEIRLFQNDRRVEKGSFDALLRDTKQRQGLELATTHIVLDMTDRGMDRTALANSISMEHTGGTGTMEIMYITINFADDMTEKAAASSIVTESLLRGALRKVTSGSVVGKITSKVARPRVISHSLQERINATRKLAVEAPSNAWI